MRESTLSALKLRPSHHPDLWRISQESITLADPVVVGILNVTPDSFSDGGELLTVAAAVQRGVQLVREGAGMLDVGGESTRPGADTVEVDEEIDRIVPVLRALAGQVPVPLSIDTRKAPVAEAALAAGAKVVNDVSGLSFDPDIADVVARHRAGVVLMHMRGTPKDMRDRTEYHDLVADVVAELGLAVDRAQRTGIAPESIALDPGIGFAKTSAQSLELLGQISAIRALGFPVLIGPSRKSFLGDLLNVPPKDRAVGTAAACVVGYQGGARLFRVHDVAATVQALAVAHAARPIP
jgi:dihydropteroate synthase